MAKRQEGRKGGPLPLPKLNVPKVKGKPGFTTDPKAQPIQARNRFEAMQRRRRKHG